MRSYLRASAWSVAFSLLFTVACSKPEKVETVASSPTDSWQCRNDLEVRCSQGGCATAAQDEFTPMSVAVDDSGSMSVCAYSGCWEGVGEVVQSGDFLLLIGHRLEFSTASGAESARADIVVAIDRADGVGTLKALEFAHPLLCRRSTP